MSPRGPELDDAMHCAWLRSELDRLRTAYATRGEELELVRAQLQATRTRREDVVRALVAVLRSV